MIHRIHLWVTGLAAALVLGHCAAADSSYTVDAWNTADGLPQGSVIAMTQSQDGYLWLGTLNGLVRFDGNSMTTFNVYNSPWLPDNVVNFLFEDSRTNLWVGTQNGRLCAIHAGEVRRYDLGGGTGKIILAEEDAFGGVTFLTASGRFLSIDAQTTNPPPAGNLNQMVERGLHLALPGKNGVIWWLEGGLIQKTRDGRPEKKPIPCPWQYSGADANFPFPGGAVRPRVDASITALGEDREGNLVVGTDGEGIYWFDADGGFSHVSTDKGLSQNIVLSLGCDREGNLWVGTDGDGLERISKKAFTTPGFGAEFAQSIAQDARGGIWTAYNRGGLTYSLTNSTTSLRIGHRGNAWSVFVDSRQRVWAGTRDDGLYRLQDGNFVEVAGARPVGPQIFALFESHDGKIWAGGQNGLACLDGETWKIFSPADGLPAGAVRALAEDASSNLWIGAESAGVFILRNGRITPAGSPVRDISCLLSSRDGVLWAGTSGHGLAQYAQGRWTRCTTTNGLAGDDVGYLMEDSFTNLWIGSYEGLTRIEHSSLAGFAAGTDLKLSCRTFLTRECSVGAQPAAAQTQDGRLLFPTIAGLVSVNPADVRPNTNPPPVVIESVAVDGVPLKNGPLSSTWPQAIVLQPNNEQLEIHFTALNFSAPKGAQFGAQFRYQLQGRDTKPTDIGGERVARFGKLAPGDYVFHVTACNEDGVWNDTGASLAITVLPPFWRKPGFEAASLLLFLGTLAGAIYLISTARLRRQLRVAQQKEMIEHERARIARDLHDQLGANLTQITLLGEMAETDKELPAEIEEHSRQICSTARETTRSLDEIVWAVNPSNDTLESLVNYACKYAQDYFAVAGLSFRVELPPGLPPTPILPEVRHNVFLAFKEAVNNVVKHAQATEARVKLELGPGRFTLTVADNGRGLGDLSEKQLRNGLKNMRRRLADIGGQFEVAPGADGGTVVTLTVPVPEPLRNLA